MIGRSLSPEQLYSKFWIAQQSVHMNNFNWVKVKTAERSHLYPMCSVYLYLSLGGNGTDKIQLRTELTSFGIFFVYLSYISSFHMSDVCFSETYNHTEKDLAHWQKVFNQCPINPVNATKMFLTNHPCVINYKELVTLAKANTVIPCLSWWDQNHPR